VSRYCYTTKWASTKCQYSINGASTPRQQSVNRVSTILGIASCIIQGLCYGRYPYSSYWQLFGTKVIATWSQPHSENERQLSVNDFVCCTLYNPTAVLWHLCIIEVLAAFIGNIVCVNTIAPQNERQLRVNTASTEHQQSINRASTQCQQSVNRVSTILGVASCIILRLCYGIDPYLTYWQPFCANEIVTRLQHLSENERQQSVNDFVCCILYNPRAVLQHLSIIEVLAAIIGNIVIFNTVTPRNERQLSVNPVSTERQQSMNTESTECQQSVNAFGCCIMYIPKSSATVYVHNQRIGSRSVQMRSWYGHSTCLKMSVNRASMILCVASCIVQGLCDGIYP